MKQACEPLYSRELAIKLERNLEELSPQCALLFRFMLETGTPLEAALKLKIAEMENFHSVRVKPLLSNGKDYYAILSDGFSEKLRLSCKGKGGDENVFPISRSNFTKTLNAAVLAIAPEKVSCITPSSISKTYFLRFFEYTHDIHDVMKYTGHSCPSRAFSYIGLSPKDITNTMSGRARLLYNQAGKNLISSIISSLEEISKELDTPTYPDQYYDDLYMNLKNFEAFLNTLKS